MQQGYQAAYAAWKSAPEDYWARQAEAIDWFRKPEITFDASAGVYGHWFPDGVTNTCYNALDRHVAAGKGGQNAFVFESPITGRSSEITYAEALAEVKAIALAMQALGVSKGDRVIIYMPMVLQAVLSMLACARLGAVHSVVFGGFAGPELATRIDDSKAKLIISASCGIEPGRVVPYKPMLDEAIDLAHHKPLACLMVQRPELTAPMTEGRDHDFEILVGQYRGGDIDCVPVAATDPLYVLYTSGTTGQPKGVVRDNGGHLVALFWSMRNFYGVKPGEAFWAASDIGWVVGHSYIVYGPLISGNTSVLFEGKPIGTPDAGTFWRIIRKHSVVAFFTAPTAFRAIRKEDPAGEFIKDIAMPSLRTLFLAGERADPDTIKWAEETLKIPVVDHWWQTETGWVIAGNPAGLGLLPIKYGSPTVPMPGYDVQVLDDAGHAVPAGTLGNVVVKLPLPPGSLPTLWNADERFHKAYLEEFPGYYKTADAGYIDDDGYLFIMARTDDIINCAGHRLSTGAMEEVCASHPDVAEAAVIGVQDDIKGQVPCGFLVLNSGVTKDERAIEKEVIDLVRHHIGPVAAFKLATCVKRLPKTRSGKVLRGTMQKIADGESWKMPATIEDPAVLAEIEAALKAHGLPHPHM
jgi:propionyl-CoA synthetase